MLNKLTFRESNPDDFESIIHVQKRAFSGEEEVAVLTADLLQDSSAEPIVSLLAMDGQKAVGHILFTKATLDTPEVYSLMHILAPLAVIPEYQNKGIGAMLCKEGLNILKSLGTDLVFVLGHIDYYPKFGFINDAGGLGFEAPFPIPEKVKDAWMVQELVKGSLDRLKGKIQCAEAMSKEKYWQE